jgi:excinuclease ABC subunit C
LAKIRRDQIKSLRRLSEEQKVDLKKTYNQDIISYLKKLNTFVVQLFNINKGVISGRQGFRLPIKLDNKNEEELFFDFIVQYYYSHEIPQEVVIPLAIGNKLILEKYLTKLAHRKVFITVPRHGEKLKLLELLQKNILATLKRGDSALFELQLKLKLPKFPHVIECFDVSNLGDEYLVGSMVHFKDGLPDKNNYRRFKIKWQKHQSDFDAIQEIIYRRYFRLKMENAAMPDLIIVDGGKPQLSAALLALKNLGLMAPVAALAKKEEELFVFGNKYSIRLSKKSDALKLVQRIRDEAHRFAIGYNRLLRQKSLKNS